MTRWCGPIVLLWASSAVLAPSAAAQTVRSDRPRILFSDGSGPGVTVETYRARCTSDAAYMSRCQGGLGSGSPMSHAAAWVARSDAGACDAAFDAAQALASDDPGTPDGHSFISNNGRTMLEMAVTLDWCFDALDDAQKNALIARMVEYADWYVMNGAPDVFHDDMNNVWSAVALAGLALSGTSADADAVRFLAAARTQWNDVIFPALEYAGDWWHEGMVYVQPTLGSLAWYALAWSTATDEDVFAAHPALFEGYLRFHAYALRPDGRYVYFGDTTDNKQSVELFSRWLIDAITTGTGSPLGQALSMYVRDASRPGYDYPGTNAYLIPLLYDASRDATATPLDTLPLARWHSPGVQDVAVIRSSWDDDATHIYIACGDYMSAHQHDEAGSFQVFRYAQLTGSTGYYDAYNSDHWQNYYSQHSVHANTLAIYQPDEFFPTLQSITDRSRNVNDGGQRVLGLSMSGSTHQVPDLDAYLMKRDGGPMYETGTLETFVHDPCYSYVACNVTAAYTSPGFETNGNTAKVTEVTRQFVFLPPDVLIVFDRIESTDPSYEKRFLLHAVGEPWADEELYGITNGEGELLAKTMPLGPYDVTRIDGFEVDGVAYPPTTAGTESGGTRIEVSPRTEAARDYFLHVLRAGHRSDPSFPTTSITQDDAQVTLEGTEGERTFTLTFAKSGALGGHVVYTNGATSCDRDLGEGATMPDAGVPGRDGGPGRDAGGGGGDGGPGGSGDDDGGCGCAAIGARDAGGALVLALVVLGVLLRRRARS